MSSELTGPDALRVFHTGAASDGAAQATPHLSFGNFRAGDFEHLVGDLISGHHPNLTIDQIVGSPGDGALVAVDGDTLEYTPPDGSVGAQQAILNGETKIIQGATLSDFVRVTRTDALDLVGGAVHSITKAKGNVVSFPQVDSAEAVAGSSNYLCLAIKNVSTGTIASVKAYFRSIGTTRILATDGYAASGAVTVKMRSGTFRDWPDSGFFLNKTTSEVLYYASRTDSELTVAAGGRDVWVEVGGGSIGTYEDYLVPVPGFRMGKEAPSAQPTGNFTNNPNITTKPGGVTFEHPIAVDSADVIDIGALLTGEIFGLWLERIIIAGHVTDPLISNQITFEFDAFTRDISGLFALANDAVDLFETYVGAGVDPDPETDTPVETSASLPYTSTVTLTFNQVNHLLTIKRNRFGLAGYEIIRRDLIELDVSGNLVTTKPSAPEFAAEPAAAGAVRTTATYSPGPDGTASADAWLVFEEEGADPVPGVDTPTVVNMNFAHGVAKLDRVGATHADATDTRVLVQVRNTGAPNVDSANTTAVQVTTDTDGPAAPVGGVFAGQLREEL